MNHKLYLIFASILVLALHSLHASPEVSDMELSTDSVTLYTPDLDVALGDYVCVPIQVKDFTNITGFQFGLHWDTEVLQFAEVQYHDLADIAFNDSQTDQGEMRLLWFDSQASPTTLSDTDTLIEICFTSMGFDQSSTQMLITSLDNFPIEVSAEDVIDYKIDNGVINLTNLLDCFLVPICIENMEINFEPGTVIFPQDIIENIDYFLACYRLTLDDIYIIDMSQPGAEISQSITYNCGDLHAPTTIGLVGFDSRTANPVDIYNILCQTTISWNIPDIYEDCLDTNRSCLDPSRCQSAEINIDSTVTTIYYDQLIDETTDNCNIEYASQYTSIALDGSIIEDGFQLTCLEYEEQIQVTLSLIQSFANGSQLVVFDWCHSDITLNDIDSTCESQDIPIGQIPINIINERQIALNLNGERLQNNGAFQHLMPKNKVIDALNQLEIAENIGTLENVSTLDMVLIWQYLISQSTSAPMAIAGDVDLSGSVSTKDLLIIRKTILGIEAPLHIGKAFMIETGTALSDFDLFDFENDFIHYYFDGPSFDQNESLSFEVFQYGDVNSALSDLHKTNEQVAPVKLSIENQFVRKGDKIKVPIVLNREQAVLGATLALESTGLRIDEIKHDYPGDIFQSFIIDQNKAAISILSPQKAIVMKATLSVTVEKDGYLNDMLSIDSKRTISEVVFDNLNTGIIEIDWTEPSVKETDDICYYPNPTADVLHLDIPDMYVGGTIGVYNVIGKLIYEESIMSNKHALQLDQLNAHGVMMIKVNNDTHQKAFRVAVER